MRNILRVALAGIASLVLVGVFAAPAQAGTSMVATPGAQANFTYTWNSAKKITIKLTLKDTACNAIGAVGRIEVDLTDDLIPHIDRRFNDDGCNTAKKFTWSYTHTNLKNIRFCAIAKDTACGQWHDNPYT